jgi:hypothetical protein
MSEVPARRTGSTQPQRQRREAGVTGPRWAALALIAVLAGCGLID